MLLQARVMSMKVVPEQRFATFDAKVTAYETEFTTLEGDESDGRVNHVQLITTSLPFWRVGEVVNFYFSAQVS